MGTDSGRLRYIRDQAGQQLAALLAGGWVKEVGSDEWDGEYERLVQIAFDFAELAVAEFEKRHPGITRDVRWNGA